ncbi:MAG TPA: phosphoenolpyruvate synthase [Candidatus Babeliales bacterium]|nr:phosphoenolpyruvate synthase [Candidatus Babeliales bacterium]
MRYIKWFNQVGIKETPLVGGKNASIGQMITDLSNKGVLVPDGFAITVDAYWYYLESNNLVDRIKTLLDQIHDIDNDKTLERVGKSIRTLINHGKMPEDLADEIAQAYDKLCAKYKEKKSDVAVRSSATAEDLPGASFAGQQETYLNIRGINSLLEHCKECFASLFTDRAIVYREEKGFDHFKVGLSIGIQKMVRSDKGAAGVAFSLDTETGFKNAIIINGSYGLGELIVQGEVVPDEFVVHKPTLKQGFASIIRKKLGDKRIKLIYTHSEKKPVKKVKVPLKDQHHFCITDAEVLTLARAVLAIDERYSHIHKKWTPMDVEWAKDGIDGKMYIVQARPETVYAGKEITQLTTYQLDKSSGHYALLGTGQSIGQKIASGTARVLKSAKEINKVKKGDIIITHMTDPSWVPAMKRCAGIITDQGGRTCHAAIVSRELGIPAIVGFENATKILKTGQSITLDCSKGEIGSVYEGKIPVKQTEIKLSSLPKLPVKVFINIAEPEQAFANAQLPIDGVGLARIEFIISNAIKIHPMAILHPERVKDSKVINKINTLTAAYENPREYFIDTLAQGIGMIAAAFYPNQVIVRFSDFKTNEYRDLIGGTFFEPIEANPMIGFRGASRYYNERYQEAFALECAAMKKVRHDMGLTNIAVMVPFVRTVAEAEKVITQLKKNGLKSGNDLSFYMMVEIPSNVLLIDAFSTHFDGFSIGSNDLTQLTLGVDRDSEILAPLFDERDEAVKIMLGMAIKGAQRNKRHIGICGQAPSDYPEIADFLMDLGIDSISLNPDAVIPLLMRYKKK